MTKPSPGASRAARPAQRPSDGLPWIATDCIFREATQPVTAQGALRSGFRISTSPGRVGHTETIGTRAFSSQLNIVVRALVMPFSPIQARIARTGQLAKWRPTLIRVGEPGSNSCQLVPSPGVCGPLAHYLVKARLRKGLVACQGMVDMARSGSNRGRGHASPSPHWTALRL